MAYLAEQAGARLDPNLVLAGARSVVMVADAYATRNDPPDEVAVGRGRVARYARGQDYHVVVKKRLHALCDALRAAYPGAGFRAFVDTAPVPEREYAARAGMGWIGKNTLLIHPRAGSYLLLGGALTTLELAPPEEQTPEADHCGTCTRCIDACPTGAITPYSVDARRCISYLTIERRGPIDPALFGAIGEWVYGCDVCQEVCPHNSPRAGRGAAVRAEYEPRRASLGILDVLGWDEAARRGAFASSAMKRATLAMMKRNALIAAGNALARERDGALAARVREIAGDEGESELVRETARAVLERAAGDRGRP
jgi:epoxyqueuosine reductase